jgi:cytochrome b6-f complex iron-sulfur subunit
MPATPSSPDALPSRRDFLGLAWRALLSASGLLALAGILRYFDYQSWPATPTEFDLGPAESYAPGSRTPLPQAQAILLRTPAGFLALSSVCPHLGCTVDARLDGFACRCHNSRFDPQGALLKGPATRPMQTLRVEQAPNGHLILHTDV